MMPESAKRPPHDDARLVNRLKHANPGKFEELVKVHLSFLLDLPGPSLEDFLEPPRPSKTSRLISKSKKRLGWEQQTSKAREGGVFGQVLSAETMEAILSVIQHLNQSKFVSEEGLFRKSGNERRKRALISAINDGRIDEELDTAIYSGHDLAEVIKLYVKELPEPLLTHKHNTAYCQIQGFESQQKKVRTIQLLVQLLPKENYVLLHSLLTLLNAVAKNNSSRMTSETLGLLFAPHVLTSRPTDAEQLRDQVASGENAALMALLIEHSEDVFKLPDVFLQDVRGYWQRMEQADDSVDFTSSSSLVRPESTEEPIQSCVTFTDRQASMTTDDYTQMQLASLCAHIGAMPDGAKKRRYAKKVTASNATPTPRSLADKHRRSKSIGESLKKFVGRSQTRRRNINQRNSTSGSSLQQDTTFSPVLDEPPSERLRHSLIPGPVHKLFHQSNHYTSPTQKKVELSSSKVVVVDMEKENLARSLHGKRRTPGSNSPLRRHYLVDSPMRVTRSMFRSPARSTVLQTWLSPAIDMATPSPTGAQPVSQSLSQSTSQSMTQSASQSAAQARGKAVVNSRIPSAALSRRPAVSHPRNPSATQSRTPSAAQPRTPSATQPRTPSLSDSRTHSSTHSRTRSGNQSRIPSMSQARNQPLRRSRTQSANQSKVPTRTPTPSTTRLRIPTSTPTPSQLTRGPSARRHIRNKTVPHTAATANHIDAATRKNSTPTGVSTTPNAIDSPMSTDSPMPTDAPMSTDAPVPLKRLPLRRKSPNAAMSPIARGSPLRNFIPRTQRRDVESPLSQSYKHAPISLQRAMNTPGSRQPMMLNSSRRCTARR